MPLTLTPTQPSWMAIALSARRRLRRDFTAVVEVQWVGRPPGRMFVYRGVPRV